MLIRAASKPVREEEMAAPPDGTSGVCRRVHCAFSNNFKRGIQHEARDQALIVGASSCRPLQIACDEERDKLLGLTCDV